ncbi:cytochrome P450 [Micromonospora sp. NBC_01392]|uniref:cytochrome P450 n=1 Tax=Micromonospora sp. NBC_01392 TaxID=2903588 RepID=UPI0032528D86
MSKNLNVIAELPADLLSLDLADPQTFLRYDQGELWRRMRAEHPVFWNAPRDGRPGFWAVTRYDDVMYVYRETSTFASSRGNVLTTLLHGGDSAAGKMLAVTDGSRHRELRKVFLKALSPRVMSTVAEQVRENTESLVRRAAEVGSCDFAQDVAEKIPIRTICDLLGVPRADQGELLILTKKALSADDEDITAFDSTVARSEILVYFSNLLEEFRKNPREGVIGTFADAQASGVALSNEEIVLNCYSLIIGGDDTSRLSMISSIAALVEHPAQWAALSSGRIDSRTATEELLRWTTPAMHFGRTTLHDTNVSGQAINQGDIVTLWNVSANRDEAVFASPDVLDLSRSPNRHLTFGYGPHFCLGAELGRIEVRAMLDALCRFTADIALTGTPKRVRSNLLSGISSLPVKFTPR